jgi:hypothetical protein
LVSNLAKIPSMSRNAFRRRDSSSLDPEFIDQEEHDGLLNRLALRRVEKSKHRARHVGLQIESRKISATEAVERTAEKFNIAKKTLGDDLRLNKRMTPETIAFAEQKQLPREFLLEQARGTRTPA